MVWGTGVTLITHTHIMICYPFVTRSKCRDEDGSDGNKVARVVVELHPFLGGEALQASADELLGHLGDRKSVV